MALLQVEKKKVERVEAKDMLDLDDGEEYVDINLANDLRELISCGTVLTNSTILGSLLETFLGIHRPSRQRFSLFSARFICLGF